MGATSVPLDLREFQHFLLFNSIAGIFRVALNAPWEKFFFAQKVQIVLKTIIA